MFPDIEVMRSFCQRVDPAEYGLVTESGVTATEAVGCRVVAVSRTAMVLYSRWPTQAATAAWQDQTRSIGPSLDGTTAWQEQGRPQGPMWVTAAAGGGVVATGSYESRPYSFDIVTDSVAESDAVFQRMTLLPAERIPN